MFALFVFYATIANMVKKETKKETKKDGFDIDIKEMMAGGCHLGHRTSKLHPKMERFVVGIRNTVHIIDLKKTVVLFEEALKFLVETAKEKKTILFVGTKPVINTLVREVAQECGFPYIDERWLGGTFSNFKVIAKRIEYFKELEQKQEKGGLEKYTKKEKIKIAKDLDGLRRKFEGIKNLDALPEAVFICDVRKDSLALKEAKMKGVKVVAIVDTNIDPDLIDYPIPANDDAISSVNYILEKVKEAIKKAKK